MSFFDYIQTLGTNAWIYGGTFILVLSILVFVHEWGHYIIARLCGVHVETFSIGFGRELFGFHDRNGTRWKVSLIPLGGYVKMFGDVDPASAGYDDTVQDSAAEQVRPMTDEERGKAFFAKPVWKRAAVVFAGPAINYIFAIILLAGLYAFNGKPVTPPVAAAVIGDSAAETAQFMPHDEILSIDGAPIASFEDIRQKMVISLDQPKVFLVNRGGEEVEIVATPEKVEQEDRFGFKHSRGLLGLISPRHAIDIDTILKIDGQSYDDFEARRAALLERMGQSFSLEIDRGEEVSRMIVHPKSAFNTALQDGDSADVQSKILFLADKDANVFLQFDGFDAVSMAVSETYAITVGTLEALGQMITGTRSARELGGVIRIGAAAGDMAQRGLLALVFFTALLSVNLGLINLFPIPMLDGGHLVFYSFEALLGRPIPERVQEYAFRAGLVFLVGVMLFTNLNDLVQLVL